MKQLTGPIPKHMDIRVPAMEAKCLTLTSFDSSMAASFTLRLYVIFSPGTDTVPLSRSSSNPNHLAVVYGPTACYIFTKLLRPLVTQ